MKMIYDQLEEFIVSLFMMRSIHRGLNEPKIYLENIKLGRVE